MNAIERLEWERRKTKEYKATILSMDMSLSDAEAWLELVRAVENLSQDKDFSTEMGRIRIAGYLVEIDIAFRRLQEENK